jgi:hypothetical protein
MLKHYEKGSTAQSAAFKGLSVDVTALFNDLI